MNIKAEGHSVDAHVQAVRTQRGSEKCYLIYDCKIRKTFFCVPIYRAWLPGADVRAVKL